MNNPGLVVVVAPDKFRGSLTAGEAADAIAAGLRDLASAAGVVVEVRPRPVADGGEGTVAAAVAAGFERRTNVVPGPTGNPVSASFAVDASRTTAVVEMAAASGLSLLPWPPDGESARTASTEGTGALVATALGLGVRRLVLGLGGSAATDGGTGLVRALGGRFVDRRGGDLPPGGAALADLERVDLSGLDPRLAAVEVVAACDVDSPLSGPTGAAAVFGPQKGASPEDVTALESGLRRLAHVVRSDPGVEVEGLPGAGAAGGTGAGVTALLGARLVPGIDVVLDLVGFDQALAGADLVITGEGRVDASSLAGKAPVGVALRASECGVPVLVLAGEVDLDEGGRGRLERLGCVGVHSLTELQPDHRRARAGAAGLLRTLTARCVCDLVATLTAVPMSSPSATTTRSPR